MAIGIWEVGLGKVGHTNDYFESFKGKTSRRIDIDIKFDSGVINCRRGTQRLVGKT